MKTKPVNPCFYLASVRKLQATFSERILEVLLIKVPLALSPFRQEFVQWYHHIVPLSYKTVH